MAKTTRQRIYDDARTCTAYTFSGKCRAADWSSVSTHLRRLGWHVVREKGGAVATVYIFFTAKRKDAE